MKTIKLFIVAALGILAAASCAREEIVVPAGGTANGETSVLTLSFDNTKTALVGGKTTWTGGEVVRIYNHTATFYQDVTVPESEAGKASAQIEVNMADTSYYAVYPATAAKACAPGKVTVNIPSNPDGLFASANICAGHSEGTALKLRNVTAVLKVNINSGNVIEILQVNAKNAMVGDCEVDLSGTDPVVTVKTGTKSATVAIGGIDGDYYIPVAPGTYAEEFAVTALRGNGGFQTLKSTQANDIAINTIYSLGTIGNDLSRGLAGEGTETSPYVISNLGEWGAFAASVNLGNPYEGKYVRLDTDIDEGVTTPIGYYLAEDEQAPFAGVFQGNNHSVALDMQGENCKSQSYVALFGLVDEGASISDLKLTGSISATGDYVAGLIGYSRGAEKSEVNVSNVTSAVKVTGTGYKIAGISGYASYTKFANCVNNGTVSGKNSVGGIVGYHYHGIIDGCSNTAEITSTATEPTAMHLSSSNIYVTTALSTDDSKPWNNGVGGVVGFAQNVDITKPANSGNVTAYMKLGGIAGVAFWTNVSNATNSGIIEGTGALNCRADSQMGQQWGSVAGGIVGWAHTVATIDNCSNSGEIKGVGGIGGIVGNMSCAFSVYSKPVIRNCVNNANISSNNAQQGGTSAVANAGTGGIVGNLVPFGIKSDNVWYCYNPSVINCINKGNVSSHRDDGQANFVGGIAGSSYFAGGVTNRGETIINGCVNEGNVTGGYWVAGILGGAGSRFCAIPTVKNCVNHGTITSVDSSVKYGAILIGGIVGGTNAYNTGNRKNDQIRIYNCYNDGDVVYEKEDFATPYIGGIIGSTWGGAAVQNTYNRGYVGPKSKNAPSEEIAKCIGALIGWQYASIIHYSYFYQGIANNAPVGTNSNAAARTDTVCSFDDNGTLSMPVTANSVECSSLLEALNQWQNYYVAYGYNNWTGPAAHPVFDTTQD